MKPTHPWITLRGFVLHQLAVRDSYAAILVSWRKGADTTMVSDRRLGLPSHVACLCLLALYMFSWGHTTFTLLISSSTIFHGHSAIAFSLIMGHFIFHSSRSHFNSEFGLFSGVFARVLCPVSQRVFQNLETLPYSTPALVKLLQPHIYSSSY